MKRLKVLVAAAVLASAVSAWADDQPRPANPGDRSSERPVSGDRGGDRPASGERGGDRPVAGARGGDAANPRGERNADAPNPRGERGGDAANPRGERNADAPITRGEGRSRDGRSASAVYIENLDKAVGLTDAQKKSIIDIFDARDLSLKDFEAKHADDIKAASKKMQDARESGDREVMAKARGDYSEILAPMHDTMKKADDDLANVLTEEQKTKQKEYRITTAIKAMAAPVELTDDQIKKLVTDAQGHEGERGSAEQKISEALDQMLTADQKATIARHKALAEVMRKYGSGRILSRDQAKEVAGICEELSKDIALKPDDAAKKLSDKIESLLTDEQKEAIKNAPTRGRREGVAGTPDGGARGVREGNPAPRGGGAREGAPAAGGGTRDGAPNAPGAGRDGAPNPAGGSR